MEAGSQLIGIDMHRHQLTRCFAALLLGAPLLLGACSREEEPADADDVREQAQELGETVESYSAAQRDEALENAQQALADLSERIEVLEARMRERWGDMDERARERAESDLETLEDQRSEAAEWFNRMKDGSSEAWGHLSAGFAEAVAALRKSWQEAEQDLEAESER
jgi:hypothetical protein